MKWLALSAALMVGVVLLLAGAGSSPQAQDRQRERDAISTCWQEQGRKSHAPAESRFIASTCEMMERRFQEKHGYRP